MEDFEVINASQEHGVHSWAERDRFIKRQKPVDSRQVVEPLQ